jgi:hypothetical protein
LEREQVKSFSSDSGYDISRLRVGAVLLFVILNLSVFFVRAVSLCHYGTLFEVGGGDTQMIYSVWKRIHALPVYEWPFAFPFSLSLYNYLFYDTYAGFLKLIGIGDENIMVWGRLFTSVFAAVGATAQWAIVRNRLGLKGARSLLCLLFALSLWVSTSLVGWWTLSIRPDMAAVALVTIAMWFVVRQPRFGFAFAGLFFYLAWSFKQSVFLTLAAVCLFLLFNKRWRDLSLMAAVFAILIAATLLFGTPEYRFNILAAPKLVREFSLLNAWDGAKLGIVENAYWILAPLALLASAPRRADRTVRLLTTIFVIAFLGGWAALSKAGGSINYFLEAFAAGSTLLQMAIFTLPARWVSALVFFGCLQPLGTLHPISLRGGRQMFKPAPLATAAEFAEASALRDRLMQMKKPIFTTDDPFALPWVSSGGRYPAFCVDRVLYQAARTHYQNGGMEGMLQRGEIPTVMLTSTGDMFQSSLNPNYEKIGESFHQGIRYNMYVIDTGTAKPDPLAK